METGQRWGGRANPRDFTGSRGRQLKAEADARARQAEAAQRIEEQRSAYRSPDELVDEAQATLKTGTAFWNPDTGEVEIDMTRSYQ